MNSNPRRVNDLTDTALTGPLLHPWDSGLAVAELQQLLRAHGFALKVDGNFGCVTEAAVRVFQRQQGLTIDGVVDAKTWAALKGTVQSGVRLLRLGDTGADVKEVQGLLQIYGHSLERHGIFTEETRQAVMAFQKQHQLKVTGLVDSITWTVLRGSPPLPAPPQQKGWFLGAGKWW